jgi:hypothetical protein
MAHVQYADFGVSLPDGFAMAPGDTHYWITYPYNWGDVVNLMAHAVSGSPADPQPQDADSQLIVENVHTSVDANGQRTIVFNVRNVGSTDINGYNIGTSIINK